MAKDLIGTDETKTTEQDIKNSKIEFLTPKESFVGNDNVVKGD